MSLSSEYFFQSIYRSNSEITSALPKCALLIDDAEIDFAGSQPETILSEIEKVFSSIHVDVHFSNSSGASYAKPFSFEELDMIVIIGDPQKFPLGGDNEERILPNLYNNYLPTRAKTIAEAKPLRLNIVSESAPTNRRMKNFCDAAIRTKIESGNSFSDLSSFAYRFLRAFTVPSMLNIDFTDLRRIARGTGLAFSLSANAEDEIIRELPEHCFTAKSGLIHFSCASDVKLNEIYLISKTIARKRAADRNSQTDLHEGSLKQIRKANLKFGIRILENLGSEGSSPIMDSSSSLYGHSLRSDKRIEMTTVLFGL